MTYISRYLEPDIKSRMFTGKAIIVYGPRQICAQAANSSMTTRWISRPAIMFKADKPEDTITFSDWKNDREMGGAAGERRVLNFILCTPYYAE